MKILVTGGAGFVGSHLTDALIALGHEVWIVDHHKRNKARFINSQAKIVKAHIADQAVKELLEKVHFDLVYHLAAQISVTNSIANPLYDAQNNLFDGITFLSWCAQVKVGKFIFASSGGAIYGEHPIIPTPLTNDIYGANPYAINKRAFEVVLERFSEILGLPYVVLRFSNIFGPRQQLALPSREGNIFAAFLDRLIVTGQPLRIFGGGQASRDYIYIDDACDALIRAGMSDFVGTVNISSGVGITIQELVDKLLIIHGKHHEIIHEPFRSGEILHSVLSYESAKTALGWEPRTPFEEGVRKMYAWYAETFRK